MRRICNLYIFEGSMNKQYIGDSVYAELEGDMIKLTTDNGMGPSNTIYLEFDVAINLIQYIEDNFGRPDKE